MTIQAPTDLRVRGLLLWEAVTESAKIDASGLILLGEACRIIDRLDRLSDALNGAGRDWLKISDDVEDYVTSDDHRKLTIKVVVDGLLSEARQQQLAYKTIMTQLKLATAEPLHEAEMSALAKWLDQRSG